DQQECLPRAPHEWEEAEADRLHDEPAAEHDPRAEPVDERSGDDPSCQLRGGRRCDDESSDAEGEAAHVVQVDDEERQDEAVPERVHDAAELQQPYLARQLRIERAQPPHAESRGSSERRYARTGRGYRRRRGGTLVGNATGAEPEACELHLPAVRRHAARDERARVTRAGGGRVEAEARAPGVRGRGTTSRGAADRGRVPESD